LATKNASYEASINIENVTINLNIKPNGIDSVLRGDTSFKYSPWRRGIAADADEKSKVWISQAANYESANAPLGRAQARRLNRPWHC
jgi:hypothetical protein